MPVGIECRVFWHTVTLEVIILDTMTIGGFVVIFCHLRRRSLSIESIEVGSICRTFPEKHFVFRRGVPQPSFDTRVAVPPEAASQITMGLARPRAGIVSGVQIVSEKFWRGIVGYPAGSW